jgi:ppGpp synthetase/RelA/SpoT-type nucleotidyltranferase
MSAADKVLKVIVTDLESVLNQCGVMYHIFSRAKSELSIKNKLEKKAETYRLEGKKMQDLLALRITLYFTDDVELVHDYLKNLSNFDSESVDAAEVDKFCPKRLNLVMRVPESLRGDMQVAINNTEFPDLIDDTYEIQIRTILSEGWHEVEHDLRYKCKDDWKEYLEESRLLNGIYATLESSEWSMLTLFDRLAYAQYKKGAWDAMIRNKMRLRFADKCLSQEIRKFLSDNTDIAKKIFRTKRRKILKAVMEKKFSYPLTYDTVLHLLNHIEVKNKELANLEIPVLRSDMDLLFGTVD